MKVKVSILILALCFLGLVGNNVALAQTDTIGQAIKKQLKVFQFNRNLEKGMPYDSSVSDEVSRLQYFLQDQGYYNSNINGQIDSNTIYALKNFQNNQDLPPTGKLDSATRSRLNSNFNNLAAREEYQSGVLENAGNTDLSLNLNANQVTSIADTINLVYDINNKGETSVPADSIDPQVHIVSENGQELIAGEDYKVEDNSDNYCLKNDVISSGQKCTYRKKILLKKAGKYAVYAKIDPYSVSGELNTANNSDQTEVSVQQGAGTSFDSAPQNNSVSPSATSVVVENNPIDLKVEASPSNITKGQSSTLNWESADTTSVCMPAADGSFIDWAEKKYKDSITVSPEKTTVYTIYCNTNGGKIHKNSVTVTIVAGQAAGSASSADAVAEPTATEQAGAPSGYTYCSKQNTHCDFTGAMNVAYGIEGNFKYLDLVDGTDCNYTTFQADPAPGKLKACYIKDIVRSVKVGVSSADIIKGQSLTINWESNDKTSVCMPAADGSFIDWAEKKYKDSITVSPEKNTEYTVYCSGAGNKIHQTSILVKVTSPEQVGAPQGYVYCAKEHTNCNFTGLRSIAYGADGNFIYLNLAGGQFDCSITTFLKDPAPNKAKACYLKEIKPAKLVVVAPPEISSGKLVVGSELTFRGKVLNEGENTSKPGKVGFFIGFDLMNNDTIDIPSLAPGSSQTITFISWKAELGDHTLSMCVQQDGQYDCKNYQFTVISVEQSGAPAGYTYCAKEHTFCSFNGTKSVAYGADGNFIYLNLAGGQFDCSITTFLKDPAPNKAKACYIKDIKPSSYFDSKNANYASFFGMFSSQITSGLHGLLNIFSK